MRWRGAGAFERRLKEATERLQREVPIAMTEVVAATHNETLPVTPKDEGLLRRNSVGIVGKVTVSRGTEEGIAVQDRTAIKMGKTLTGKISFKQPYAVKVHEMSDVNWTTEGTGGKFLERTVISREPANKKRFSKVKVFKG